MTSTKPTEVKAIPVQDLSNPSYAKALTSASNHQILLKDVLAFFRPRVSAIMQPIIIPLPVKAVR